MEKKTQIILTLLFLLCPQLYSSPDSINHYFIKSAKTAKSSVVSISIYNRTINNEKTSFKKVADATGTIVSSDGDVITNYHVVSRGNFFEIVDHNGNTFQPVQIKNKIYIADIKTDIAVLRINNSSNTELQPIKFSDSNELSVGEWVIAIGNPYGLNQSITSGIVSSTGRDNIGFTDIEDFIQTDVSINPGNSGGPLVNLKGEMVGINTAIRTVSGGYQGISFAIPSNIVKQVYSELLKFGRVRRGWLGFIAKEKRIAGIGNRSNIEIISVMKNSPAFTAGIKTGDYIRKIDGMEITSLGSLIKSVASKPVGSKLYITAAREGRILDYRLVLREQHDYNKIKKTLEYLFDFYGIEIDENAESENIIISYISPKTFTYLLRTGDIIYSINDIRVISLDDFIQKFNKLEMKISKMVLLRNSKLFEVNLNN